MGALFGFLAALVPSCQGNCNANNCAGCCDSTGKCVVKPSNQTDATCGTAGAACVDCTTAGQKCTAKTAGSVQSYVCAAGTGGGSGNNCGGCLTADNFCAQGITNDACGSGGVACSVCPAGKPCTSGVCGTDAGVGSPCAADTDCQIPLTGVDTNPRIGIRPFCKHTSSSGTFEYPRGYCTKRCGLEAINSCDPPNGSSAVCVFYLGYSGEYDNQCMKTCTRTSGCRDGYGCHLLFGVCLPLIVDGGFPPILDPGPGFPAMAGAECHASTDCNPPSTGFCVRENLPNDGGPSGFPGGECSADCAGVAALVGADAWCGSGGVCNYYPFYSVTDGKGPVLVWQCDRGCGPDFDAGCRTGYVCDPHASWNAACIPDCHNPGAECLTGTCQDAGLCQ